MKSNKQKRIILAIAAAVILIALVLVLNRGTGLQFQQVDQTVRVLNYKIISGGSRASMFLGGGEFEGQIKQPIAKVLGWIGGGSIIKPLPKVQLGRPPPNEFAIILRYTDDGGFVAPVAHASLEDAKGHTVELRRHGIGYDLAGRERIVLWYVESLPKEFEKVDCEVVLRKETNVVAKGRLSIR